MMIEQIKTNTDLKEKVNLLSLQKNKKQKAFGALSKYADPEIRKHEKDLVGDAIAEKYVKDFFVKDIETIENIIETNRKKTNQNKFRYKGTEGFDKIKRDLDLLEKELDEAEIEAINSDVSYSLDEVFGKID